MCYNNRDGRYLCGIGIAYGKRRRLLRRQITTGDSDSTAIITGNIVGARVGYKNIPDYYKDNIELKDVILELADDMAKKYATQKRLTTDTFEPTDEWLDKIFILGKERLESDAPY